MSGVDLISNFQQNFSQLIAFKIFLKLFIKLLIKLVTVRQFYIIKINLFSRIYNFKRKS